MAPRELLLSVRNSKNDKKAREKRSSVSKLANVSPVAKARKFLKGKQKNGVSDVSLQQNLMVKKRRRDEDKANESECTEDEGASSKKRAKKEKHCLVVGLDQGTTFSTFAYALSTWPISRIIVNKKWPGSNGAQEKVPTTVAFLIDNPGLTKDIWGYLVTNVHRSRAWWKLLFAVRGKVEDFRHPLLQEKVAQDMIGLPEGISFLHLFSYFFGVLCALAHTVLNDHFTKAFMNEVTTKFVITVPANWDEREKQLALKAAKMAGLDGRQEDELVMITEPEAAAMIALSESIADEGRATSFQPKTSTIVVDIGGGTTDLKSYTVIRTNPMRLSSACVGKGGYCGATFIYFAFLEFLKNTFGEAFTCLPISTTFPGGYCQRDFEDCTRGFDGNEMGDFKVRLVKLGHELISRNMTSRLYDHSEGCVRFTCDHMKSFFQKVIDNMRGMVEQQIDAVQREGAPEVKTIILCGGLANCDYIVNILKDYCRDILPGNIQVKIPNAPWSAVARGAVLHGLQPYLIESKKSAYSYGIELLQEFQEGVDRDQDAYRDPVHGKRAMLYAHWFFKKGDKITQKTEKSCPASVGLRALELDGNVRMKVYKYDGSNPPQRLDAPGVEKVADAVFALKDARPHNDSGFGTKDVKLTVFGSLGYDTGLLEFSLKHNGKIVGRATVEYYTLGEN